VPHLLYDAWLDARNIIVAIKPSVDPHCFFALLPIDVIYHILFLMTKLPAPLVSFQNPRMHFPFATQSQIKRAGMCFHYCAFVCCSCCYLVSG
jgi:hypothetical protein